MKKRISRRYTYKKLKLDYVMQIMELFHPEELILEIFSIDKLSYLEKGMLDKEKVLFTYTYGVVRTSREFFNQTSYTSHCPGKI